MCINLNLYRWPGSIFDDLDQMIPPGFGFGHTPMLQFPSPLHRQMGVPPTLFPRNIIDFVSKMTLQC